MYVSLPHHAYDGLAPLTLPLPPPRRRLDTQDFRKHLWDHDNPKHNTPKYLHLCGTTKYLVSATFYFFSRGGGLILIFLYFFFLRYL